MVTRASGRGPQLPYRLLAGVIPAASGWLIASAKLQGATIAPEEPRFSGSFLDVLDYKPAYQVITLFAPIGLYDSPVTKGRACERDARRLLGSPRAGAIASAPPRSALGCSSFSEAAAASGGHLSPIRWRQLKGIEEVDKAIAPYWQRTVFEVHPELSFFQLGGDSPLRYSKHTGPGLAERRERLTARLPSVERILDAHIARVSPFQLLDAAACLWTARRVAARAVNRLPEDPEWDAMGLRMEIVR